jgi:alpha-tubulin suppressor-like RCC1 family protein
MDVTNLILHLKSKITSNTIDQQYVSKAIKLLELGAVEYVDGVSQLPPVAANTGRLYYVAYDGLYWSTGVYWLPIVKTSEETVWAWGCNAAGVLGDGTTVSKSSPVLVVGGFTDWCQISANLQHSHGIRSNGTAWSWGCGWQGRMGTGLSSNDCSPRIVAGGFTDWRQISAGDSHGLGVRTNGTAWGWGINSFGEIGANNTTSRFSPVSVVGGFTDWCQVSAGFAHSLGLRCNGTAWAWGNGLQGRLGDNTATPRSSPVSVVGGFTDWCQVSAGGYHSLALRTNGSAWVWGGNSVGQLGDGTTTSRLSPVSVVGGFTDWCQVSAGSRHSLGVRCNGTAWSWGCNVAGPLGDGTTTNRSSPVSVVGGFTDWCQVSAGTSSGSAHSVALRTNGTAWAWGCNGQGQLGDGSTTNRSSPVCVAGGVTDWSQVSAGGVHSIVLRRKSL